MNFMGYTGIVELDEESQVLLGRVVGLRDVITFEGDSVTEVTQAFRDSVDDYLEFCARRGESPEKPYSGQFVLRLDPSLHGQLASAAEWNRPA
jgi:predicted HicB family RNase H-like nuclease